jgi:hypothetical protein
MWQLFIFNQYFKAGQILGCFIPKKNLYINSFGVKNGLGYILGICHLGNASQGTRQSEFSPFGHFLKSWAGFLGLFLTGEVGYVFNLTKDGEKILASYVKTSTSGRSLGPML